MGNLKWGKIVGGNYIERVILCAGGWGAFFLCLFLLPWWLVLCFPFSPF
jgi:hypothetical protein